MAKTDVSAEIRRAVDTGKIAFGAKESESKLKNGTAKLLIVALNAPQLAKEKLLLFAGSANIPVFAFQGSGLELGSVCGKPFAITTMVVEQEGKSRILDAAKA